MYIFHFANGVATQESSHSGEKPNNELAGADQSISRIDYVLKQSMLVTTLTALPSRAVPDTAMNCALVTSNGFTINVAGDTENMNQVCICSYT